MRALLTIAALWLSVVQSLASAAFPATWACSIFPPGGPAGKSPYNQWKPFVPAEDSAHRCEVPSGYFYPAHECGPTQANCKPFGPGVTYEVGIILTSFHANRLNPPFDGKLWLGSIDLRGATVEADLKAELKIKGDDLPSNDATLNFSILTQHPDKPNVFGGYVFTRKGADVKSSRDYQRIKITLTSDRNDWTCVTGTSTSDPNSQYQCFDERTFERALARVYSAFGFVVYKRGSASDPPTGALTIKNPRITGRCIDTDAL